ncbi:hypothetical protein EVAR_39935_1 [Eumeta japonica]|uniref:Uncharacterized protein n=1 Tax=Eumeta variegata TaxID=151549 RepID=A0A4C1X0N7_EUMVA|nr:hypothetical protein EVAR_39935_1 [Eumeta japonica]
MRLRLLFRILNYLHRHERITRDISQVLAIAPPAGDALGRVKSTVSMIAAKTSSHDRPAIDNYCSSETGAVTNVAVAEDVSGVFLFANKTNPNTLSPGGTKRSADTCCRQSADQSGRSLRPRGAPIGRGSGAGGAGVEVGRLRSTASFHKLS